MAQDDLLPPPPPKKSSNGDLPLPPPKIKKDGGQGSGNGLSSLNGGFNAFPNSPQSSIAPSVLTPQKQAEYVKSQQQERKQLSDQLNKATGAFRAVQGDDLANEVQSIQPQQTTLREPEKAPSFTESVSNTANNIGVGLQQFIPNTALAVGGTLETVFGKDLGSDIYQQVAGGNPDAHRIEAYQALEQLEPQFKKTRGLIEAGEQFDVAGLAAASIDAVGSLVRTAVTAVPTAGLGLYSDMVGSSVAEFNKAKAKNLGITVNELYQRGDNEFVVPATIGGLSALTEQIGLKGAQQAMLGKLKGSMAKKIATVAGDVNKEGLTEWVQTGLEASNKALGEGKDATDATKVAVDEMFSKKGLESYLMGVVASGGAAGLGRLAQSAVSPKSKESIQGEVNNINRMTEEIVNPDATPESKEFVEKQIRSTVGKIVSEVDKDIESVDKLGAEQKREVETLQGDIAKTETVINDPAVSPETKVLAEEENVALNEQLESKLKEKPKKTKLDQEIEAENEGTLVSEEEIVTPNETVEETLIEEGGQDALEIESTDAVDVSERAGNGETLVEGNTEPEITTEQSISETVQESKEEIDVTETETQSEDIRPESTTGSNTTVTEEVKFTRKDLEELSESDSPLSRKGDIIINTALVGSKLPKGEKVTFFAEKERTGTWDGKSIIEDGTNNPWGLVGILADNKGWVKAKLNVDLTDKADKPKTSVKEKVTELKPTKLQSAKEKLTEKREALKKLNITPRIASDPKQKAKALYEYHSALVDVAKEYISEGITDVKEFAKEIGEKVTKSVQDAWDEATGGIKLSEKDFEETTTLRNSDVEQKREDYGFNEPVERPSVTNEETLNKAIDAIKENGQVAYDVIDKALNREPLNATEMAILAQFQGTKEAQLIEANEKIEEAKDSSVLAFDNAVEARNKIIDDLVMAYDASELSGNVAGQALQARKIKVLQDYSLANMLIRTRKANDNRQLTNEQIKDVTDRYNALVETEKKLNEKLEKLQEENSKLKLKEFTPKIRVEAAREARQNKRTQTKETLKKERDSIFEEMRKVIKKSRGELSANPIPVEMIPLVGKLAKNYFVDGMTSIEAIVDKIHGDLTDIVDGVTKRDVRDAISGYNRDTRPTKDDLQKDIQDLKTQARLISQIEDAEAGVKKVKDETKRKQASDEVEMLRARLKDLTKGETSLENLKSRVKKQIAETQKRIENRDYSKKESDSIPLDEEARKLQDAYRKIKWEFDVAVAKDQLKNRTKAQRYKDLIIEIANIPRALMATADLSAPLRQGIIPSISNPIMAKRAFEEMIKQWGSEGRSERWLADLKDSPAYTLMQESGLYIADKSSPAIAAREEDFQTNLAEKIPVFGKLVKASERAYVGYLNKMRADLFSKGVDVLQNGGKTFASDPKAYKALATYINATTGRGNLGALDTAAPVLNTAFFSPRLMASRLQLLSNWANPSFYKNTPVEVRKMYFKDMAKFISFGVGILAIASMYGGDVEDDPRSPDFGKIRHGNTRWDIWGGFQQYVRYFAQLASGEKKSTASGNITQLDGSNYNKETRLSVLGNLVRSKLAPVPAFVVNLLAGENMVGDKFKAEKDIPQMLLPLVGQGIYESAKQDGWMFALGATGVPSVLGVGVQTYGANDFLQQGVDDKALKLLIDKKGVAIEPKEGDKKVYDVKTGEDRDMTDAEFKKYYATWADVVKKGLDDGYSEYSKMTPKQFEKEFRKLKTRASKEAKESVLGFPVALINEEFGNKTYELTPEQVKLRATFYKEYLKDHADDFESEEDLKRNARKFSKDQMSVEGYAPDGEGKYKLNLKD